MMKGERKVFRRPRVGRIALLVVMLVGMLGTTAFGASAVKKYHSIPAYQMRDVYSNQKVEIGPIDVLNGKYSYSDHLVDSDVTFTIYNSTLQKIDQVVTTKDGKLPKFTLTEGLIIFLWYWIILNGTWRIDTFGFIMGNFVI